MPPPQNPAAILTAFGVAMDKSSALQLTKRCLPHLERKGQHRWGKSWGYEIISFILVYGLILHHASLRPLPAESIAPFVRWFSHAFSLVGISPRSWKSDWDWKCEAKESVPWFLASSLVFRFFGDEGSGSMDLSKTNLNATSQSCLLPVVFWFGIVNSTSETFTSFMSLSCAAWFVILKNCSCVCWGLERYGFCKS